MGITETQGKSYEGGSEDREKPGRGDEEYYAPEAYPMYSICFRGTSYPISPHASVLSHTSRTWKEERVCSDLLISDATPKIHEQDV